jgi:hypothetical protein
MKLKMKSHTIAAFIATLSNYSAAYGDTNGRSSRLRSSGNDSNPQEYCSNESTNLGICLGQKLFEGENDNQYTQQQLVKCTECSGMYYMGDESCLGLKALNDIRGTDTNNENNYSNTNTDGATLATTEDDEAASSIDWHESFCMTYDNCVNTYCPSSCMHEQNAWVECMVLELDCDWRCTPGGEGGIREQGIAIESSSLTMMSNSDAEINDVAARGWILLISLAGIILA